MKIVGIQKNSFVDYPGKIAAVVFTLGCNMNCFYCHNRGIIKEDSQDIIDPEDILEFLKQRKKFLDGVVISGGEPTLQKDLMPFISAIKDIGFRIKLDTNGSRPDVLMRLINENLLNYIAMDIKAPLDRYEEICGIPKLDKSIKESIKIIRENVIFYEFRTTVIPQLNKEDILKITDLIKGARKYVLQQYRIPEKTDDFIDERLNIKPYNDDYIVEIGDEIKDFFDRFEIRGLK